MGFGGLRRLGGALKIGAVGAKSGTFKAGGALKSGASGAKSNIQFDRARFKAFKENQAIQRVAEREKILSDAKAIQKRGGSKVSLAIGKPGPIRAKIKRLEAQLETAKNQRSLAEKQIRSASGDRKVLLQAEQIKLGDKVEELRHQLKQEDALLTIAVRFAPPPIQRKSTAPRRKTTLKKVAKKPLKLVKPKVKTLVRKQPSKASSSRPR